MFKMHSNKDEELWTPQLNHVVLINSFSELCQAHRGQGKKNMIWNSYTNDYGFAFLWWCFYSKWILYEHWVSKITSCPGSLLEFIHIHITKWGYSQYYWLMYVGLFLAYLLQYPTDKIINKMPLGPWRVCQDHWKVTLT